MSLNNKQYDVSSLAEISSNGVTIALFPQIRDAIARKMKEIYGNDIDISSASADGQYINMEALIYNNVYRTLENIMKNLDPMSAGGKYLDILAGFSGATRRQPTYSTAQLYVWNTSGKEIENLTNIVCVDKNGNEWVWYNPVNYGGKTQITIPPMTTTENNAYCPFGPLEFRCREIGPVTAFSTVSLEDGDDWKTIFNTSAINRGGDIYQTFNVSNLEVVQIGNALPGEGLESDSSLRSRRTLSFGESGATVLNSITANLLNIEGVEDVFVYSNNMANQSGSLPDGQNVSANSVYICVWPNQNIVDTSGDINGALNQAIGQTIYDQMTPGIPTQKFDSATNGGGINSSYAVQSIATNINELQIYWKTCVKSSYKLSITLKLQGDTVALSDDQKVAIKQAIISYLNNVKLGMPIGASALTSAIQNVDFKTQPYGFATYRVAKIVENGSDTSLTESYALPLTRFYLTDNDVEIGDPNTDENSVTTISISIN